jgi:hypothetical protein
MQEFVFLWQIVEVINSFLYKEDLIIAVFIVDKST